MIDLTKVQGMVVKLNPIGSSSERGQLEVALWGVPSLVWSRYGSDKRKVTIFIGWLNYMGLFTHLSCRVLIPFMFTRFLGLLLLNELMYYEHKFIRVNWIFDYQITYIYIYRQVIQDEFPKHNPTYRREKEMIGTWPILSLSLSRNPLAFWRAWERKGLEQLLLYFINSWMKLNTDNIRMNIKTTYLGNVTMTLET